MKLKTKIILFFVVISVIPISAAGSPGLGRYNSTSSDISAYRSYKDVDNISINVPTVVEVPFTNESMDKFDFAVIDKETNSFEPIFFKQETSTSEAPLLVTTNLVASNASLMIDKNFNTYADFQLSENARGYAQITLSSEKPIVSSGVNVLLGSNVSLPKFIEIRAFINNQDTIVVANRTMNQQFIYFPQTTSDRWTIDFTFDQPLRISELQLKQDNVTTTTTRAVRFLAQPLKSYRVYFNPDRPVVLPVKESGSLSSAKDVLIIQYAKSQNNPSYVVSDADSDGIADILDNCISIFNSDQIDKDNNKMGDACQDFDRDGVYNSKDNCLNDPNRNQKDSDSDGIGDVCDKEESRITEKFPWIPWVGIGFAVVVLITLFVLTARSTRLSN